MKSLTTFRFLKFEIILLLLYFRPIQAQGRVNRAATISLREDGTAPVCKADALNLTCTAAGRFLEWSFSLTPENATASMRYIRTLQLDGPNHLQTYEQMIGSTTFLYSRSSAENMLPLVSMLSISPVSEDLNGTVVNCTDVTAGDTVSTTINVLNEKLFIPKGRWQVNITAKKFESIGVTVIMHWWLTVENNISYLQSYHSIVNINATVVQQAESTQQAVNFTERTSSSVQFNVTYDTLYNVTLVELFCDQSNIISLIEVYFNETICQNFQGHHGSITVMGSRIDSVPTVTTFGCQPEDLPKYNTMSSNCIDHDSQPYSNEIHDIVCTEVVMSMKAETVGAILGGVFAFTILLLGSITCAVIVVKLVAKKGSGMHTLGTPVQYASTPSCEIQLCSMATDATQKNHKQIDARGLVYADIGASFNQRSNQRSIASVDIAANRPVEYAQINYTLSTSHSVLQHKGNDGLVEGDDSVCVNLDNLLFQLRPQVTSQWYQFGLAVGIENETLGRFAEQCAQPEDCIVEMLDHWLRNATEKPTWRDVTKALKVIKLPQLAFDIESVYTTGKLPVKINKVSVTQFQENPVILSMAIEEVPPPIPPKNVKNCAPLMQPAHNNNYYGDQKQFQAIDMQEYAAPALPPKPNKI